MIDLKNKVALVTGGGRDIGKAVSLTLAKHGARVVINYLNSKKEAEETVKAIVAGGGKAVAIQADVTKASDAEMLVKKAVDAYGGTIDILINVVGGLVARKKMEEMDEEFWEKVLRLNLTSAFLVTKAVLSHMKEGGAIVNFSSQAGRDGGGGGRNCLRFHEGSHSYLYQGPGQRARAKKDTRERSVTGDDRYDLS